MAMWIEVGYVFTGTTAEVAAFSPNAIDEGAYVRDTDLKIDYWVDPFDRSLVPRKTNASYPGFSVSDGTNVGATIEGNDTVEFNGGSFVGTSVTPITGKEISFYLDSTGTSVGQGLYSDGAGGFVARSPVSIGASSTNFLNYDVATGVLTATPSLIQSWTDSAEADISAFVAADYTLGSEFQVGDVIRTQDGSIWMHNGGSSVTTADFTQVNNGLGGISSFSIAADSGTTNSITDAEVLTFIGGTNVNTSVGANQITIDVSMALADLSDVPGNPGIGTNVIVNNNGAISYQSAILTDFHLGKDNLGSTDHRTYTINPTHSLTFVLSAAGNVRMSDSGVVITGNNLEFFDAANGQIKKSPNGTRWIQTIDNNGRTKWNSL